jgi:hypothetical protein
MRTFRYQVVDFPKESGHSTAEYSYFALDLFLNKEDFCAQLIFPTTIIVS